MVGLASEGWGHDVLNGIVQRKLGFPFSNKEDSHAPLGFDNPLE